MTFGVDYASVDGDSAPHWASLEAAGASFVWIRASYGYYNTGHGAWALANDATFQRDWKTVPTRMVRGAYMFPVLEASQSVYEQVASFKASVDAAGGLRPGVDFPPCLDIEFPGKGIKDTGLDRAGVLNWLSTAVSQLHMHFGCYPILYTSGRVWNDTDADCLGNPPAPPLMLLCPLWLARYTYATRQLAVLPPPEGPAPPVPTPWGDEWHAHQDQGDALGVPGFTSTVDVDRFRVASPGTNGGHVAWAKKKLGITSGGDLFDSTMKNSVKTFQAAQGLVDDAIIGPRTFAALAWLP